MCVCVCVCVEANVVNAFLYSSFFYLCFALTFVDSCQPNCALDATVMDIIKCVINNIHFSVGRLSSC